MIEANNSRSVTSMAKNQIFLKKLHSFIVQKTQTVLIFTPEAISDRNIPSIKIYRFHLIKLNNLHS